MSTVANRKKKAASRSPKETSEPKKTRRKAQKTVVKEIREKVEDKLAKQVEKAGLGDYIKLVALEKELKAETTPREMRVTWVEDSEK